MPVASVSKRVESSLQNNQRIYSTMLNMVSRKVHEKEKGKNIGKITKKILRQQ